MFFDQKYPDPSSAPGYPSTTSRAGAPGVASHGVASHESIDLFFDSPKISLSGNPTCYLTNEDFDTRTLTSAVADDSAPSTASSLHPSAFAGLGPFLCTFTSWLFLTFLVPGLLLFIGDSQSKPLLKLISVILFGMCMFLGTCVGSARTFLVQGLLCKPHSPPRIKVWGGDEILRVCASALVIVRDGRDDGSDDGTHTSSLPAALIANGIEHSVHHAKDDEECRQLANSLDLARYDSLLLQGGDAATVHEFVNGYLSRSVAAREGALGSATLGFAGTTVADFGGLSGSSSVSSVVEGRRMMLDVASVCVGMDKTSTIASVGTIVFGAPVEILTLRRQYPAWSSLIAHMKLLSDYSVDVRMELTFQDNTVRVVEGSAVAISVSVTQHCGGTRLSPFAKLDDGLINLSYAMCDNTTKGDLLAILHQLQRGKGSHYNSSCLSNHLVRSIKFDFERQGVFCVDGRMVKHDGRVCVECLEREVEVFANSTTMVGI
jgi:diacylglycerol kinase family enzyme